MESRHAYWLCGVVFVPVVKPTDLGERNDLAHVSRLNRTDVQVVYSQRKLSLHEGRGGFEKCGTLCATFFEEHVHHGVPCGAELKNAKWLALR